MRVLPGKARGTHVHGGKTYSFCSESCAKKFAIHPEHYLSKGPDAFAMGGGDPFALAPAAVPASQPTPARPPRRKPWRYDCPMCEGVGSDAPGACPRCGMDLELSPEYYNETEERAKDYQFEFWAAVVLSAPVLVYSMAFMHPGAEQDASFHSFISPRTAAWIEMGLTAAVLFWPGWSLLRRGWEGFRSLSPNMFSLVALGALAAWIYSCAATLAPGWFPEAGRHGGAPVVYYDSAAAIVALVLLGQHVESRGKTRASAALRELLKYQGGIAHRIVRDVESDVPVRDVREGDLLRVKPGERIPVDGTVRDGASEVDESSISGEPLPVAKSAGAAVTGGTMNILGSFTFVAEQVGEHTFMARVAAAVAQAQHQKPPVARLADRVTRWFVPAVIGAAILTFFGWLLFGPEPAWASALASAASVLVVACPCALGLATPMAVVVACGRAARMGIVIRDAAALETASRLTDCVLDKTGTLTLGRPEVSEVLPCAEHGADETIALAASVEQGSEHPVAKAILNDARRRGASLAACEGFVATPGGGVSGTVGGRRVLAGNLSFVARDGAAFSAHDVERARALGKTLVYVAEGGEAIGIVAIDDAVRAHAAEVTSALAGRGIRLHLVTGDHAKAADALARKLDITQVRAGCTPLDKAEYLKSLRKAGARVAMVGDGVNDAPALAAAHVGIAMGEGAGVALDAAPVTLVRGDLRAIVQFVDLARTTMRIIRQNLFWAFIYNIAAVPVAAGALTAAAAILGAGTPSNWLLSPMIAAAAMAFSSVLVILNSLRIRVGER
jgi:Cu+-exporting ATPase